MNRTIQDLKTRRSCRSYKSNQITAEELDMIMEAGTYAPTGMGAQSPIIIAVQDKATIKQLSQMNAEIMGNKDMDPFYGAPTVLVVLADKEKITRVEDGSLVLGNMMLAAHALGIGSCWVHRAEEAFASSEGKKLLKKWGIKGDYVGVGHCILGYPEGKLSEPKERKEEYITKIK